MKENTLIIFPAKVFGDKNTNVQLYKSTNKNHIDLKSIVRGIVEYGENKQFSKLNLFIQGDQSEWTMIESWSDDEDLFFEFCKFVSDKLSLKLEIY